MQFIVQFIPWIAYAVLVDATSWPIALGVCLALSLALVLRDLRTTGQVDVLGAGGIVFFTLLLVPAVAGAPAWVQVWSGPASNVWIAALMWLSLALHRPFVQAAARREAPAQVWDLPFFTAMVTRITTIWAFSYAVGSAVLVATTLWPVPGASTATNVLQVVVAVLLMRAPIAASQAEGERLAASSTSTGREVLAGA